MEPCIFCSTPNKTGPAKSISRQENISNKRSLWKREVNSFFFFCGILLCFSLHLQATFARWDGRLLQASPHPLGLQRTTNSNKGGKMLPLRPLVLLWTRLLTIKLFKRTSKGNNEFSATHRPGQKQVGLFRRIFTPHIPKKNINSHVTIRSVVRDLS